MLDSRFTTDFLSHHLSNWRTWFSDYAGKPDLRFLEIGSFEGRSACWFLENILTGERCQLVCVDSFNHSGMYASGISGMKPSEPEARFRTNVLERFQLGLQVRHIRKDSFRALVQLSTEIDEGYPAFDVIYVDGSHLPLDALTDSAMSWRLLKRGGLLLLDDYDWDKPGSHNTRLGLDGFIAALAEPERQVVHKGRQVLLRKLGV